MHIFIYKQRDKYEQASEQAIGNEHHIEQLGKSAVIPIRRKIRYQIDAYSTSHLQQNGGTKFAEANFFFRNFDFMPVFFDNGEMAK